MKHIKSFELIVEGVEVKTNRYQRAHGKKPKGFGQWAFYFNDRGGDPIFTPTSMNYTDAVKWAKDEAKKAGKTEIYVGESVNEGIGTTLGVVALGFLTIKLFKNIAKRIASKVGENVEMSKEEILEVFEDGIEEAKTKTKRLNNSGRELGELLNISSINRIIKPKIETGEINTLGKLQKEIKKAKLFNESVNEAKYEYSQKELLNWIEKNADAKTATQFDVMTDRFENDEAKKAGKTEIYVGESVNEGEILELNEFFEVIYSDGISQKKDFKSKSKAIEFMRDEISSNKKLKNIAVYKGGSGFYSTSQTDRVISFWGDGSYLDNLSKKDKDLASKKMNEGKLDEYANIDLGEDLQAALDMIEAKIELIKSKTSDKDWIKALDVIERAYYKFFDTVAKYTTKLGVVPLDEAYSNEERMELAKKGLALDDGSFPIKDLTDLKNAIQAYGRAKDQAAAAKFIAKRAKALGAEDLIPDTEDFQKSLKESLSYSNLFVYGNEIKDEKDLVSILNTFDNYAEMSDDRKKGDKMYSAVRMIKQFADKNKIKLSKLRNKLNDKGQTALKRYLL